MGTSAYIFKNRDSYTPEKLLSDALIAVFHSNAILHFDNNTKYSEEGSFEYTVLNIIDKSSYDHQIVFYVQGVTNNHMEANEYYGYPWLVDKDQKLSEVAFIEHVDEDNAEMIMKFAYEYLKRNPYDYFFFGDEWAFGWTDFQRLMHSPFNVYWYQNDPQLL